MKLSRARTTVALLAVCAVATTGCGRLAASGDTVVAAPADGSPPAAEYTGPLDGKKAAAKALECYGKVFRPQAGLNPYEENEGASTPEGAIANWKEEVRPIAQDGYELAVRKGDRALFTYTYNGRVRSAAIAVDDKDPKTYLKGWGVLDAAWCDPSEFPPGLDGNHEAQVWTDADGHRVDTRIIHSSAGPAHCNWESATFLFLDNWKKWYLRDPEGVLAKERTDGKLAYVRGPYKPAATLPEAAVDSGYRRDGMALHLTENAAYVEYEDHVEAWPRTTDGWGCA